MCQMPNICHIYHTKHKNGALWDVLKLKNYTTCLHYCCKFATIWTNIVKNLLFYILFSLSSLFIFSFLVSLTLRFPLSSPCTSSLSLRRWSFRDRHVSRTKLRCRFRLLPRISSVKHENDKRLRFALKQKITDATELSKYRLRKRKEFEHLIHHVRWNSSVWIRRVPSISPSSLSSLFAFHSASLWLWDFFFFFFTAIWVNLMVVVGSGLWAVTVAMVVDCGGDGRWWLSVFYFIVMFILFYCVDS